jgi:hypothetical protein
MITKDFHFMKDFRQIRGKTFVIMKHALALSRHNGHSGRARPARRARAAGRPARRALASCPSPP